MTAPRRQDLMIGLSAVAVSVGRGDTPPGLQPRVFVVRGAEHALSVGMAAADDEGDALPFGPFDPVAHETLEQSLRGWVESQTPLRPGYVEQLYTFGNRGRYAAVGKSGVPRVISIGYLALIRQDKTAASERLFWGGWYDYFPWEDGRRGRPKALDEMLIPALRRWAASGASAEEKATRLERARLCFGLDGAAWDDERVLDRYELLYEARLVHESLRDKKLKSTGAVDNGRPMLYDHRRILATAMTRLRGKLKYRPVVFELMPREFTLLQLQQTVEALMGRALHKQNFRRMVESSGMIEAVPGKKSSAAGGRPAALFRFRAEARRVDGRGAA